MPAPVLQLYRDDDVTLLDAVHKIDFGVLDKGTISPVQSIHLWNDQGATAGAGTAVAPHFYVLNAEDANVLFDGTPLNHFKSMIEARSCGARNVSADAMEEWTPVGPTAILTVGDMPQNTMRVIEVRVNIPSDATNISDTLFTWRVSA